MVRGLDHPGLTGLQIDRAVNVDALTPARLLDREFLLARRPAAGGPRGMGWMYRVREQHDFVVRQGIQEIFVALDERLLLLFVELARNDTRLVILQPQTMQERDQSRAAFINEPEFLLDPGADLTGRTRQCSGYPRLQIVLLLYTQIACAAAHIGSRAFHMRADSAKPNRFLSNDSAGPAHCLAQKRQLSRPEAIRVDWPFSPVPNTHPLRAVGFPWRWAGGSLRRDGRPILLRVQ